MKFTQLQINSLIVSMITSMVISGVIGLIFASNVLSNSGQSIRIPNKTIQLALKVVCEEAEGYCELKKVLPEYPKETSFTVSHFLIIHEDFHYPTFVEIYSLRKEENRTMRSHIAIGDYPPPIFS